MTEQQAGYQRKYRDKRVFSGNREVVLNRDEYQCRVCQSTISLEVHHKDGTNHKDNHVEANNDPANLITLCKKCHARVHMLQRRYGRIYSDDDDLIRSVTSWIELVDPINRVIYYGDY
jgi:5-methylcytosine-specific restriction endonuclease McrA